MADDNPRRKFISFGETIALAALAVSAFGVWVAWTSSTKDGPTRIVEQKQAIPLVLRGSVEREGRVLVIEPVEPSHALQSLTITLAGKSIEVGSDGGLDASAVEGAIGDEKDRKGSKTVPARIIARYVEAGTDRRSTGSYQISYRWEGGGLFGGRSVRLTGLRR